MTRWVLGAELALGGVFLAVWLPLLALAALGRIDDGLSPWRPLTWAVLPVLSYALAWMSWMRLRRSRRWAGGTAAVVSIVLLATLAPWVVSMAHAVHEEWSETQPGGRGYRP